MKITPCPCSGCNNGRHSNGLRCRWCGGKGQIWETDWPKPCWNGYGSDHLPPSGHSHAKAGANAHDPVDAWLPVRNAVTQWTAEHYDEIREAANGVRAQADDFRNRLAEGETLKRTELEEFLTQLHDWWQLNAEFQIPMNTCFTATDTMLHALHLTTSK
jgi:hypothetical protein